MANRDGTSLSNAAFICYGDVVYFSVYIVDDTELRKNERQANETVNGYMLRLSSEACGIKADTALCTYHVVVCDQFEMSCLSAAAHVENSTTIRF